MAKELRNRTTGATPLQANQAKPTRGADDASGLQDIDRWSNGVFGFAALRWAKDLNTQQALMGCKTLAEVQKVQLRYLSDAIHDYTIEMPRFLASAASIKRDGLGSGHADDHMGV